MSTPKSSLQHIADLTSIVNSVDKKQEVMAANMDNLNKRNEERHEENVKWLTSIHEQVKETNGSVADLKSWRQVHQEWTSHEEKAFVEIGAHVDEIEDRQEEVRRLLQTTKDRTKEDKRWTNWMWAAVIGIGMPLIILLMNVLARGLEKHLGW